MRHKLKNELQNIKQIPIQIEICNVPVSKIESEVRVQVASGGGWNKDWKS